MDLKSMIRELVEQTVRETVEDAIKDALAGIGKAGPEEPKPQPWTGASFGKAKEAEPEPPKRKGRPKKAAQKSNARVVYVPTALALSKRFNPERISRGNNRRVFAALMKLGRPASNDELAAASGVASKSVESSVYQLRKAGVIQSKENGIE